MAFGGINLGFGHEISEGVAVSCRGVRVMRQRSRGARAGAWGAQCKYMNTPK